MEKQQFSVTGTTCKSCEVVIERELKKNKHITSISVSHNKQKITIEADKEFSLNELNSLLHEHNYTVTEKNNSDQKIEWDKVIGLVFIVIITYVILQKTGVMNFSMSANPSKLLGVFAVGLVASISSCAAVVGGLVAAVSSSIAQDEDGHNEKHLMRPHILFNVGRLLGFVFFGAIIGFIGSGLQLSTTLNGIFIFGIALTMVVIGVNLTGVFPAPVISLPKKWSHKIHDLAESKDPKAPLLLGALTFFLPCGFTQSMQLFALSLQSAFLGGLVMGVFALGTAPALLAIGGITAFTKGKTLKKVVRVMGVVVLVLALSNINNGLTLIGINPGNYLVSSADQEVAAEKTTFVGDRQQITMNVTEYGQYSPSTLSVKKGIPVDWTIIGADFMGCANTLVLRQFGVNTYLKPGKNLVQFTPTSAGKFTFSCSMGMVRGTMIVTK